MQLRFRIPAVATALAAFFVLSTAVPAPQSSDAPPSLTPEQFVRRHISYAGFYVKHVADPRIVGTWNIGARGVLAVIRPRSTRRVHRVPGIW